MSDLKSFNQAVQEIEDGIQDLTVNGKCSSCGQCCSNYLPLSKYEIENIRRYIQKHAIQEQLQRFPTRKQSINLVCPFRSEKEKKCLIYPVRPGVSSQVKYTFFRQKVHTFEEGISPQECQFSQ